MIGSYYNSTAGCDQTDIVKKIKGNTNDQTGSDGNVCQAVEYALGDSVDFETVSNALSFSSAQNEIDGSDPFVAKLVGSSMSHVVVVSGYQTGTTNYLYVLDPDPGVSGQYFSYTQMINGATTDLGTRPYGTTMRRN
jgi:hypothetical protein